MTFELNLIPLLKTLLCLKFTNMEAEPVNRTTQIMQTANRKGSSDIDKSYRKPLEEQGLTNQSPRSTASPASTTESNSVSLSTKK